MKLFLDPISTTSRPLMMFVEEHNLQIEIVWVSLMRGEHRDSAFLKLNPNGCVPVLSDGGFILSESSTILRYLADIAGSPAYPTDLRTRARINSALDWLITSFHASLGPQLAYPTLFPEYYDLSAATTAEIMSRALADTQARLAVLDAHMIGPARNYIAGEELTIADYVGGSILALAEAAQVNLGDWSNVSRWLATLKARPSWDPTYAAFYGMLSALRPA